MREIWKASVIGWYEASNLGRVRSIDRYTHDGRFWRGKVLRAALVRGYPAVSISINGHAKKVKVHILVAVAFKGPRQKGVEVNHKDGNRENCKISNIEYSTRVKNAKHASKNGLMPTKRNGRWRRVWHP